MGVFDFEATNEQHTDGKTKTTVSVIEHGSRSLRMTIPKDIALQHGITSADHLVVQETDKGFQVSVVSI